MNNEMADGASLHKRLPHLENCPPPQFFYHFSQAAWKPVVCQNLKHLGPQTYNKVTMQENMVSRFLKILTFFWLLHYHIIRWSKIRPVHNPYKLNSWTYLLVMQSIRVGLKNQNRRNPICAITHNKIPSIVDC